MEASATTTPVAAQHKTPDTGLWSLVFNILIPVAVLNYLSSWGEHGPLIALFLALAFPLGFGLRDLARTGKINYISLLGVLNVVFTGGLALMAVEGIWFAIKEAAFPALIGCFVFASAYTKKPFIKTLFLQPAVLDLDKLQRGLDEQGSHAQFNEHLKRSTQYLSASFALSAVLNFWLAMRVFTEIDPLLENRERAIILNEQIARMTSLSFVVIMVPSLITMALVMWHLFSGLKKYTGFDLQSLAAQNSASKPSS